MNEPAVTYEYDVSGQPILRQEASRWQSRAVQIMPRRVEIRAASWRRPGELYVLVDGRAMKRDGGWAERGQHHISFEDNPQHDPEILGIAAAPAWIQKLVAEVREFERKRLA